MRARRWGVIGVVVVVLAGVAVLAVPLRAASEVTATSFERSATLGDVEVGDCVEIELNGELSAREVSPVLSFLPWSQWADAEVSDLTIETAVNDECPAIEGAESVDSVALHVLFGEGACVEEDLWADDDPTADTAPTSRCEGRGWEWSWAYEVAGGVPTYTSFVDGAYALEGFDGCLDVQIWADLGWSDGDGAINYGLDDDSPAEAACLT